MNLRQVVLHIRLQAFIAIINIENVPAGSDGLRPMTVCHIRNTNRLFRLSVYQPVGPQELVDVAEHIAGWYGLTGNRLAFAVVLGRCLIFSAKSLVKGFEIGKTAALGNLRNAFIGGEQQSHRLLQAKLDQVFRKCDPKFLVKDGGNILSGGREETGQIPQLNGLPKMGIQVANDLSGASVFIRGSRVFDLLHRDHRLKSAQQLHGNLHLHQIRRGGNIILQVKQLDELFLGGVGPVRLRYDGCFLGRPQHGLQKISMNDGV